MVPDVSKGSGALKARHDFSTLFLRRQPVKCVYHLGLLPEGYRLHGTMIRGHGTQFELLDVLNKTTKKPQPVKWPRCGSSTSMHTNWTAMLGFSQDGGTLAVCIHRHQEVICLIAAQHCTIPREENAGHMSFRPRLNPYP